MLRTCKFMRYQRQVIQFLVVMLGSCSAQDLSTYLEPCSSLKDSTSDNTDSSFLSSVLNIPSPHGTV